MHGCFTRITDPKLEGNLAFTPHPPILQNDSPSAESPWDYPDHTTSGYQRWVKAERTYPASASQKGCENWFLLPVEVAELSQMYYGQVGE